MSSHLGVELNPEQRAAVCADEPVFFVIAPAGSGKTRVLTSRFLTYVVDHLTRPDEILTITFTRKAAAEMKRRIVEELQSLGLVEEARLAEVGPIQTIHGFLERTLRENALAAGVDPDFEVAAESDMSPMVWRAFEEVLGDVGSISPLAQDLVAEYAGEAEFAGRRGLESKLYEWTTKVLEKVRGASIGRDQLASMYRDEDSYLRVARGQLIKDMEEAPDLVDLAAPGFMAWFVSVGKKGKRSADELEAAERDNARKTCGLMHLVLATWRRHEQLMSRDQVFDFQELEAKALQLLRGSPATVERIHEQYKMILVDESQDVNPLQYELIDSLQGRNLLYVGDASQSIYGWRHADVEVFRERTGRAACHRLTTNYRSDARLIDMVNSVFGSVWPETYEPMQAHLGRVAEPPVIEAWHCDKVSSTAIAGRVAELVAEGESPGDIAVLCRTNSNAAEIAVGLRGHGIGSRLSGSEQFYAKLEVRDLANCLAAAADPGNDYALLATLRSPIAGLSLDGVVKLALSQPVWTAILDPVGLSEQDAYALAEFRRWFLPLQSRSDRIRAWEAVSEVLRSSPYLTTIAKRSNARQTLANVRKLLRLAAAQPEMGPKTFADRVRDIQGFRHKEGEAPADDDDQELVTLLTVHKAKGLEWNTVVLADLLGDKPPPNYPPYIDARRGLVSLAGKGDGPVAEHLVHLGCKREREESERLLYVAMTRARRRLCLVLPKKLCKVGSLCKSYLDGREEGEVRRRGEATAPGQIER